MSNKHYLTFIKQVNLLIMTYIKNCFSRLYLFVSFVIIAVSVSSQSFMVTGTVIDETKEGMPGVTVKVDGSDKGTTTDLDGKYALSIDDKSDKLVFSFIGYKKHIVQVNDQVKIDVQLKVSTESLDEVVVIGYGKTTVKELTGATVQVKGESVERLNIPRMDQALQGQVSGVAINTNSGSPGGSSSIRIRGLSTFGDNDPLILVDGVVYDLSLIHI